MKEYVVSEQDKLNAARYEGALQVKSPKLI